MLSAYRSVVTDSAVLYSMLAQGLAFLSAIVTTILILAFFSPAIQGYYYTFNSLLGLQEFVILGIGQVLQQFVSHEWAGARAEPDGAVFEDGSSTSNHAGLFRFLLRWYAGMGIFIGLLLCIVGFVFIHHSQEGLSGSEITWAMPWFLLSIASGMAVFVSSGFIFLEGCNQVPEVRKFRVPQLIFSRLAQWVTIVAGGKLWACPAGVIASIAAAALFLLKKYGNFFKVFFNAGKKDSIRWKRDILPVQWRFAVSSVSRFLLYSTLTPILFATRGPIVAGRFGITWTILNMAWGFCFVFMSTRIPEMAMAASARDVKKLDRAYLGPALKSVGAMAVCAMAVWVGILFFYRMDLKIAERFLPPAQAGLFALGAFFEHVKTTVAPYVLVHKREPFWWVWLLEAVVVVPLYFFLAEKFGLTGAATGFLALSAVSMAVVVRITFHFRKRRCL